MLFNYIEIEFFFPLTKPRNDYNECNLRFIIDLHRT